MNKVAAILHDNIVRHDLHYFGFPSRPIDSIPALVTMSVCYGITCFHGLSLNPVITRLVVRDANDAPHTTALDINCVLLHLVTYYDLVRPFALKSAPLFYVFPIVALVE